MAHRRLMVQLCLIVEDLPEDERAELARDALFNDIEKPEELPRLAHYEHAEEFGLLVSEYVGDPEAGREMFAGSDVFVRFTSAELISAQWDGDISEDDPINLAGSGPLPISLRES